MAGTTEQEREPSTGTEASRLCVEIERLRDEANRYFRKANRRASFWAVAEICIGFPAAVLAGLSGATGLAEADARVPAAVLALTAAGFAAGAGVLRGDRRRVANKRARRAWADTEAEARVVLAQSGHLSEDALVQGLRSVFAKRDAALTAYEDEV